MKTLTTFLFSCSGAAFGTYLHTPSIYLLILGAVLFVVAGCLYERHNRKA